MEIGMEMESVTSFVVVISEHLLLGWFPIPFNMRTHDAVMLGASHNKNWDLGASLQLTNII